MSTRRTKKRHWIKIPLVSLLLIILIFAASLAWVIFAPQLGYFKGKKEIVKIRSGSSRDEIVELLLEKRVIRNRKNFVFVCNLFGYTNKLKAGKYEIPLGLSNYSVLKILVKGKAAIERVTIPEGVNHRRIASILQKKIELDSSRFVQLVNDSSFTRVLGISAPTLEGYLYPDTYYLPWGLREEETIGVLVKEFQKHFPDSLKQRAAELGLTPHQAIILASIIEGEVMVDSERPIISAVYHNRLKRGILLQADPTIQYIIPGGPRRLRNRDLEIDSPYNTYKHPGLPPGPINNPGVKSILAALYPANVNYLYLVARGDGSHIFSANLQDHLRAKSQFDLYRRQVARQQRQN
ncbi:MAG: endolytic transglycosylase MltG [candidate division KSB1 bacterium]|nr:endolytic transglycosylase MltG [candidate division KSB1 bacterium]